MHKAHNSDKTCYSDKLASALALGVVKKISPFRLGLQRHHWSTADVNAEKIMLDDDPNIITQILIQKNK